MSSPNFDSVKWSPDDIHINELIKTLHSGISNGEIAAPPRNSSNVPVGDSILSPPPSSQTSAAPASKMADFPGTTCPGGHTASATGWPLSPVSQPEPSKGFGCSHGPQGPFPGSLGTVSTRPVGGEISSVVGQSFACDPFPVTILQSSELALIFNARVTLFLIFLSPFRRCSGGESGMVY
jgi:hypothetical protein